MEGYRTRQPGLWDDAEWSELGLPAEPPAVEVHTEDGQLPVAVEPEIAEIPTPTPKRSSSWD